MKTMTPLVSIITPSYNQAKFIRYTIESVLAQNYPRLEYIIIDGGSTDGTIDILKEYGDRIKWISEPDKGQTDAINKGFRLASGDIIAWLNSDDTYEPEAVQTAAEYFLQHPEVALVYGQGNIIDETGEIVSNFPFSQEFNLWKLVNALDYILQPTTFFTKRAIMEIGYLDVGLCYCMDWDLWIKIANNYPVGFIRKTLANSREYGDTKTSTGGWRRIKEIYRVMISNGSEKLPRGLFLYGLDTLRKQIPNIPFLGKKMTEFTLFLNRTIDQLLNEMPTIEMDNWVGPKCNIWVPQVINKTDFLNFRIFIPPENKDLRVRCFTKREKVLDIVLPEGVHEFSIPKDRRRALSKLLFRSSNLNLSAASARKTCFKILEMY